MANLLSPLTFLYGADRAPQLLVRAEKIIAEHRPRIPVHEEGLTERDSILITYGDQVQAPNEKPLQTLRAFCKQVLTGVVSGIHILPFYPWTSDDGFSVADYRKVDPALGDWKDISSMQSHFRLMFDGVINHVSSQSEWFNGFLQDDPHYRDYFIAVEGSPDLSQVARPRALPLLTTFKTSSGEKRLWTTFSDDQVDLNYTNPDVLLEMLDVLLMYVERGATFLRLDAIAYLWKEIGTACIHLPQAHQVVQFLRAALDEAAPHVQLITETNVPHADNISYFGDGTDEAQLVYNFALPPLTLHTFYTGEARVLSNWARTLIPPSDQTTFLNFLASHDGIGLEPARGILSRKEVDALVQKTLAHGGLISYKRNSDGSQSPYELNINYFDALSNPNRNEPLDLQADRFMAAQAVMLSLAGVPGIYFHSLFGSRGWIEGVKQTGRNRTINRQKLDRVKLESELADPANLRRRVFDRYARMLRVRGRCPAFHPHGGQQILDCGSSIFALARRHPTADPRVLCLQNVSNRTQSVKMDFEEIFGLAPRGGWLFDLITNQRFNIRRKTPLRLSPYRTLWLVRELRDVHERRRT